MFSESDVENMRAEIVGLVRNAHSIHPSHESFDTFITKWLPDMIVRYGHMDTERKDGTRVSMRMVKPRCMCPDYTPEEAIMRHLSYTMRVYVDMVITYDVSGENERVVMEHDHMLCTLPLPVLSSACKWRRQGGSYRETDPLVRSAFVINGIYTYISSRSALENNRAMLHPYMSVRFAKSIEIRSVHTHRPHRSTSTLHVVYVRPTHRKQKIGSRGAPHMAITIPFLGLMQRPRPVPLPIIIASMGCSVSKFCDIVREAGATMWCEDMAVYMDQLMAWKDSPSCQNETTACEKICAIYKSVGEDKTEDGVRRTIYTEVLPHLNTGVDMLKAGVIRDTNRSKIYYLAWCAATLARALVDEARPVGDRVVHEDDQDACSSIIAQDHTTLYAMLFRQVFCGIKYVNFVAQSTRQTKMFPQYSVPRAFNETLLTSKIHMKLATGTWSEALKGVTQDMSSSMVCNVRYLVNMARSIRNSVSPKSKNQNPRLIQPDAFGYVCPSTSEGENCGLTHPLAWSVVHSVDIDGDVVWEMIRTALGSNFVSIYDVDTGIQSAAHVREWSKIFDGSGRWNGWVRDAADAVRIIRNLRRSGCIHKHASVYCRRGWREVHLSTIRGRLMRPLIVIDRAEDVIRMLARPGGATLGELVYSGCIEYMDAREESLNELDTVAVVPCFRYDKRTHQTTHLEISDSSAQGFNIAILPGFNHNQGARNVYQSAMGAQILPPITFAGHLFGIRNTYVQTHSELPIYRTTVGRKSRGLDSALGHVPLVMIGPNDAGQEDGIVMKQEFIDRGAMSASRLTPVYCRLDTHDQQRVCVPSPRDTVGMLDADYSNLDENGVIRIGSPVYKDTVLIGMVVPVNKLMQRKGVRAPRSLQGQMDGELAAKWRDVSIKFKHEVPGGAGQVIRVNRSAYHVSIVVSVPCPPVVGDKFTSPQGQKGVMTRKMRACDMPHTFDGDIPDIIMTFEGPVSRMTMGTMLTMVYSTAGVYTTEDDYGIDWQVFDRAHNSKRMDMVREAMRKTGLAVVDPVPMIDGRTGRVIGREWLSEPPSPSNPTPEVIFRPTLFQVGLKPYMALHHKVSVKMHGRQTGPIDHLTRQPRSGRKFEGGMRTGGMEFSALNAIGAAYLVQERSCTVTDESEVFVCRHCKTFAIANPTIGSYYCKTCSVHNPEEDFYRVIMSHSAILFFRRIFAMGCDVRFTVEPDDDELVMQTT